METLSLSLFKSPAIQSLFSNLSLDGILSSVPTLRNIFLSNVSFWAVTSILLVFFLFSDLVFDGLVIFLITLVWDYLHIPIQEACSEGIFSLFKTWRRFAVLGGTFFMGSFLILFHYRIIENLELFLVSIGYAFFCEYMLNDDPSQSTFQIRGRLIQLFLYLGKFVMRNRFEQSK